MSVLGTACIVKGSYCQCHYCKCEHGHLHCKGHGHGGGYGKRNAKLLLMLISFFGDYHPFSSESNELENLKNKKSILWLLYQMF